MKIKKTTRQDLENAIKKAEEGRKLPLTQEGIKRINEISRRINEERKIKMMQLLLKLQ